MTEPHQNRKRWTSSKHLLEKQVGESEGLKGRCSDRKVVKPEGEGESDLKIKSADLKLRGTSFTLKTSEANGLDWDWPAFLTPFIPPLYPVHPLLEGRAVMGKQQGDSKIKSAMTGKGRLTQE